MRTVIDVDVDVDDETLTEAARELGTTTKVATVNQALKLAAARRRTTAYLDLLAELDLVEDEVSRARAPLPDLIITSVARHWPVHQPAS